MTDTRTPGDTRRLAEAIRQACVQAALAGYEDASLSGLCREGAWEAAVSAIRRVDVAGLAQQFASPGPPAAGSAAAVTGAIAAGLLASAATLSERHGTEDCRARARAIARRATALRSSLASAAQQDAETVGGRVDAQRRATDALLDIGARCSRAVGLAAEVATRGHPATRPDARAALRLASSAAECALDLAEENLRDEADAEWARGARRRAWRARLPLQRAASLLRDEEPL